MGKKLAIALVVILIAGLAIMGYYLQLGRKNLLSDPYRIVPTDAAVVIETIDLKSFLNSLTTGSGLFGELSKIKDLDNFNYKLKFITDILNREGLKKVFTENPALITFHPELSGHIGTMVTMTAPGDLKIRHIREILATAGILNAIDQKLGDYRSVALPYTIGSEKDTAYISLISSLLVCTNSRELLARSEMQAKTGNDIRKLPGFSRVLIASGKNVDKMFIVFGSIPRLIKPILAPSAKKLADNIAALAGTMGADIYINEDGLTLNGYTESADSTNTLNKYKNIVSRDFHSFRILPASTVMFETVLNTGQEAQKTEETVNQATADLARRLMQFKGSEVIRAVEDNKGQTVNENTILVFELTDRNQAEQQITNEPKSEIETLSFKPDDQVNLPVYSCAMTGLAHAIDRSIKSDTGKVFITFYDNYMIMGSSYNTVTKVLYDNILNKTLANDLNYRDFRNTLPSRAGYYLYLIPSHIIDFLAEYLRSDIIDALNSNRSSLEKIQAVGFQFASSNGMIYNSFSLKFKQDVKPESTAEWETLLDTTAAVKPFFFINHNTGAKEIFIQDLRNNTYLINAAGRVLWKVPLNERITSSIYMIDYYRNGKYQLLFSGKNFLHILDRNGNYVERFPVKLRSPSANPMVMFDYDNNLNYRIFIAGEDKMIYSYEKTGNVVKGWTPFRTNGTVKSEISYFKVSGKDYLVAADENSIYFLDRTGNKRLSMNSPAARATGSAFRLIPGSDPYLVCSAPDGTIQHIFFDGTVKKFTIREFSAGHTFDVFDVDGDGFGEYIFIDKGILYLYNHNRAEIFKREFGSDSLGGPINFIFSSGDRKIGVFDVNKNLIYLIGSDGKDRSGFPLRGASMFSIGKLSDKSGFHLIVGGTDRFLYNYKIDDEVK